MVVAGVTELYGSLTDEQFAVAGPDEVYVCEMSVADPEAASGLTEPTAQPTNLVFDLSDYPETIHVSFTAAVPPADVYIALCCKGAQPDTDPVDDTEYEVGDDLGNAKVVHIGSGTTFDIDGTGDDVYHVKIYSANEA